MSPTRSRAREAAGIAGYFLCTIFVALLTFPFFVDGLRGLAAGAQWQPDRLNQTVPMPLTIFFVIIPALAFIVRLVRSLRVRSVDVPLGIRAAFVAAILGMYVGSFAAVHRGQATWDTNTRNLLAQAVRPGMAKDQVERMFAASAGLTGLAQDTTGPVTVGRGKPNEMSSCYDRKYNGGFGADWVTIYKVELLYSDAAQAKQQLLQARYVTEHQDFDRNLHTCKVLMEVPARPGRKYPYEYDCPR